MEYNELFARTELLVGKEAMNAIASKQIILFGVGGVGSWCAEGLIRTGVMHLTIVDPDRVALSNINRQLPATTQTVGQLKVEAMKNRLLEINPFAEINAIPQMYCEETSASFHLETYDYIIDAIDALPQKAHLLLKASKTPATVFSSMGAALKIDPQSRQGNVGAMMRSLFIFLEMMIIVIFTESMPPTKSPVYKFINYRVSRIKRSI
jgi:tRNA A37 threonylcarbamoyladenosine dehydratase